jgi:hypothetical protein
MKKTIFCAFLLFFLTIPIQSFADEICGTSATFEYLNGKNPTQWCYGIYPANDCNNNIADFCVGNYHYHIRCYYDTLSGLGCVCGEQYSEKEYCEQGCENGACKSGGQISGTGLCNDDLNALGGESPAEWCQNIQDCYSDGATDVCEGDTLYRIRCSNDPQAGLCLCDESRSDIINCTNGCTGGECLEAEDVACEWIRDGFCGGGDCEIYEVQDVCGPSGCDPTKSESECKVPGEKRCTDKEDCLQAVQECDDSNNIIEGNEQCSGSNLDDKDCSDFGFTEGNLSCEDCVFDVSECSGYIGGGGGGGDGGGGGGIGANAVINNPLDIDTVVELINRILNFIWKLAIVFAPVMLLVGGFYIMTAGGNPTNLEKGKKIMIYTIIGFAIVLLSRGIVALVKDIIGVEEDLSFLQFEDTLKLFCFSGIIGIKKTFFKRSANK